MPELTPHYHWVVPEAHPLSEATIEKILAVGRKTGALKSK